MGVAPALHAGQICGSIPPSSTIFDANTKGCLISYYYKEIIMKFKVEKWKRQFNDYDNRYYKDVWNNIGVHNINFNNLCGETGYITIGKTKLYNCFDISMNNKYFYLQAFSVDSNHERTYWHIRLSKIVKGKTND